MSQAKTIRVNRMVIVILIPASLVEGRKSARELKVPMRVRSLEVRVRMNSLVCLEAHW